MQSSTLSRVQKQEQKVTSCLIHGLNMLSLPTQAVYSYLVELSMSNPLLEIPEAPATYQYENVSDPGDNILPQIEYMSSLEYKCGSPSAVENPVDFDPFFARGELFEADTLSGSLELQLSLCDLTPAEHAIGQEIIGNIDDSGYFVGNLLTICLLYGEPLETGQKVLSMIQDFSPSGIAARDVYEALCLQVDDAFPFADITRRIIHEDLQAICNSRTDICTRKYGVSEQNVSEIFDYIRRLEPRPGNCDSRPFNISYVLPDLIVRRKNSGFSVYLSGGDNPLHINEYYLDILKEPELDKEDKVYLHSCLNEARSLIHSIDIRSQTMHKFALALFNFQTDFFRHGPEQLRPFTMQQMAVEIGVNVSTVSRIVRGKYISTPWGLFPLKYFFTKALRRGDGDTVSTTVVKQRIAELISGENPSKPLTDTQICLTLQSEGCQMSRRTVSKYRQSMGFCRQGRCRCKRS